MGSTAGVAPPFPLRFHSRPQALIGILSRHPATSPAPCSSYSSPYRLFSRTSVLPAPSFFPGPALSFFLFGLSLSASAAPIPRDQAFAPGRQPDRICLSWTGDPATTQAVTWRTSPEVQLGRAEIALADASPAFVGRARMIPADSELLDSESGPARYHEARFTGLQPATQYAYRVGTVDQWSEWLQFRTASAAPDSFSFIYFGDAQNDVLSLWSRAIRAAFCDAPQALFMLHAGDLIDAAEDDRQWGEWFAAGGFIHAMIPTLAVPGNHEYVWQASTREKYLSGHWRPSFALPENGPPNLTETCYWLDVQGVRMVCLDSNLELPLQAAWLDQILTNNPQQWTIVTFHHPVYSSAKGRDNDELRCRWKPLIEHHGVDLVLQGHDHTYARGRNLPEGLKARSQAGTVYVVSVSGPKMYGLTDERWMDRGAENTQLYQVITVAGERLHYRASTVTGELYDGFTLVKNHKGPNQLIEQAPPGAERRWDNTLRN